jgi:hypothetical protein
MTETTGATDRTRTILDPSFVDGLDGLSLDEVRARRDEALVEREFQSFLRRLLQGREDLLQAERERRESGQPPAPLVERLTAALAEGPRPTRSRGEALRDVLTPEDLDQAAGWADAAAPTAASADPSTLSDEDLRTALDELALAERQVSEARTAVLRVHDRLQEELTRRYRDDPSSIPQGP